MIYRALSTSDSLDQGDVIDDCPVPAVLDSRPVQPAAATVQVDLNRVIVLTQTCDLAQGKAVDGIVASVFDAQQLVDTGCLKAGRR